jgi:hypothetical protein
VHDALANRFGLSAVSRQVQHHQTIGSAATKGFENRSRVIRAAIVHETDDGCGTGRHEFANAIASEATCFVETRND